MITDIVTVMRKDLTEFIFQRSAGRSALRGGWFSLLLMLAVFGIFIPLQTGPDWIESPAIMLYWAWVPLFLAAGVTADAIAGERERRTLETLLASRLSDMAILLGKILAAIAYGWGFSVLALVASTVTVNVANWNGSLRLYPASTLVGGLVISLLASALAAIAGTLVSLRSATVRQAAQTTSIAIMLVLFIPMFGLQALPDPYKQRLIALINITNVTQAVLAASLVLLVLDVALLGIARARFQRPKLILD